MVLKCLNYETDRTVALKIVNFNNRSPSEYKTLSKLTSNSCENVVQVYDKFVLVDKQNQLDDEEIEIKLESDKSENHQKSHKCKYYIIEMEYSEQGNDYY